MIFKHMKKKDILKSQDETCTFYVILTGDSIFYFFLFGTMCYIESEFLLVSTSAARVIELK